MDRATESVVRPVENLLLIDVGTGRREVFSDTVHFFSATMCPSHVPSCRKAVLLTPNVLVTDGSRHLV